ncbi:hypothetical protein GOV12_06840 [Candidatus Pacearchaeota archaeon]|nr:hypothetical protein [Candidatus Pacearchaeota archaeon]
MANIKWCCKQKKGLKLIEPNENMSQSYIKLAESSIGTMNRERNKNNIFSISAGYYSMYYSLYSILINIGIKCEIHQCTIKFLEKFLNNFYSKEDINKIYSAFKLRNIAQYYVDKILDEKEINNLIINAPEFLAKSKQILSSLNEDQINEIRDKFKEI